MEPVTSKKTPVEMIKLAFSNLLGLLTRKKSEAATPPSESTPSATTSVSKEQTPSGRKLNLSFPTLAIDTRTEKVLIAVAIIFALLIALAVIARVFFGIKLEDALISPTPTPTAVPVIATPPPTRYATDSAVLKIESDINSLENDIKNLQIEEGNIKPRELDFNISFK